MNTVTESTKHGRYGHGMTLQKWLNCGCGISSLLSLILLLLVCVSFTIIGQPRNSGSLILRDWNC